MDNNQEIAFVSIKDIRDNPYQVRKDYDATEIATLSASIKEYGLLQIPVARKTEHGYQLAFGHRRKRAFELLYREGLKTFLTMPLLVMSLNDREMFEISLTENLKRQDLNPIERAAALKDYMNKFGATSVQAAKLFGIPESTIRGMIRLLNLPEEIKHKVATRKMSQLKARKYLEKPETKAKRILDAEGQDLQKRLVILLYGSYRSDVTDDMLFRKIKNALEENQQLLRQVELLNSRKRDVAKTRMITQSV